MSGFDVFYFDGEIQHVLFSIWLLFALQVLVFLLAPPEELPQLKREKSISQMVAEKLKALNEEVNVGIPADAIPTTFGESLKNILNKNCQMLLI